jgi:hypothetical protein
MNNLYELKVAKAKALAYTVYHNTIYEYATKLYSLYTEAVDIELATDAMKRRYVKPSNYIYDYMRPIAEAVEAKDTLAKAWAIKHKLASADASAASYAVAVSMYASYVITNVLVIDASYNSLATEAYSMLNNSTDTAIHTAKDVYIDALAEYAYTVKLKAVLLAHCNYLQSTTNKIVSMHKGLQNIAEAWAEAKVAEAEAESMRINTEANTIKWYASTFATTKEYEAVVLAHRDAYIFAINGKG